MKQFTEAELRKLLEKAFELGFVAGKESPVIFYADEKERDKELTKLMESV